MVFKQSTRSLNITTPLGLDAVQLTGFVGEEELSRLFTFNLNLISSNSAIQGTDLVGKNVAFSVDYDDEGKRYFNGYVKRFSAGDEDSDGKRSYQVVVVPWLWFLTQTSDCRIFQNMTALQVIEKIFKDLGFNDFDFSHVKGSHAEREYWVQYRETDFNFVSRLMEDEGIFYFFKHEADKHTLVLTDSKLAFKACKESTVDYPNDELESGSVKAHIRSWEHNFEFKTGAWTHTDYNFKTPGISLRTNEKTLMKYDSVAKYELYDYPGEYQETNTGKSLSRVRMEEIESDHDVVLATSDCKSFMPAGSFTIGKHRVKAEENKEYVIRRIHHEAREGSYETGAIGGREYFNQFECIPIHTNFRPSRITPKPIICGCQTAVVTGPIGQEIYPDAYGRIKVQFHWDRVGKGDENTSCWIRTSQQIAGKRWGFMAIPRIGQEVVVEFLEGDPDRPLVTGCVYNAEQMPHYSLPNHKTKSYIKTNSSLDGQGHNEIRFEDKANEEQIYIHAERNMDLRTKNDLKEIVINDRHLIVGDKEKLVGDQCEMVYRDKNLHVKRNQIELVEGNVQQTVGTKSTDGGRFDVFVEKQKTEYVGRDGYDLLVNGNRQTEIVQADSLTVGGNQMVSVGGNQNTTVKASQRTSVGNNLSFDIRQNYEEKTGAKHAVEAGSEIHLKSGMKIIIEAGAQLSLVGPGGFIDIGPAGVTIQGTLVKINSGGAAGSGSGASPENPDLPAQPRKATPAAPRPPMEADNSQNGQVSR